MDDNEKNIDYIINDIIKYNEVKLNEQEKNIEKFKLLYNITLKYSPYEIEFEDVIKTIDDRIEFLVFASTIALKNDNIDEDTRNVILQICKMLSNYLLNGSKLKEITIPENIKSKIEKNNYIPTTDDIKILFSLIMNNEDIYNKKFKNKDFSQTIEIGLHKNIKEVLSIGKDELSHLLGLTSNKSSLYEFYRKKTIYDYLDKLLKKYDFSKITNYKLKKLNKIKIFMEFKKKFKLNLTLDNLNKLINYRYKNSATTEENLLLNDGCEEMPKRKTIDFYLNLDNIKSLIKENNENKDFIYEYIRKNMFLTDYSNKNKRAKISERLSKEEIDKLNNMDIKSNNPDLRLILDKYIADIELQNDSKFQEAFTSKFGYRFPLIEYNKLLLKNINFYNFSLFDNLNSIIVDYVNPAFIDDKDNKRPKTDLFLVSYSKKYKEIKDKQLLKLMKEEEEKYKSLPIDKNTNIDKSIDMDYLRLVKSLEAFPPEQRYYFKQMNNGIKSTSILEKHKDDITSKLIDGDNISVIGFATRPEEKERIDKLNDYELKGFNHNHYCETNESKNYYEYITDLVRNGVEYPISIIYDNNHKILKLSNYYDETKYIMNSILYNYDYLNNNILNIYKNKINNLNKLIQLNRNLLSNEKIIDINKLNLLSDNNIIINNYIDKCIELNNEKIYKKGRTK